MKTRVRLIAPADLEEPIRKQHYAQSRPLATDIEMPPG